MLYFDEKDFGADFLPAHLTEQNHFRRRLAVEKLGLHATCSIKIKQLGFPYCKSVSLSSY